MNDYSINIKWVIRQFKDETNIINADTERQTRGIYSRYYRQRSLGDLLVATGHEVNYSSGEVRYVRESKNND